MNIKKKAAKKKKPLKKKAIKTVTPPMNPHEKLKRWFHDNMDLINITGWERKAGFAATTLRQISSGKRKITLNQEKTIWEKVAPKFQQLGDILKEVRSRLIKEKRM